MGLTTVQRDCAACDGTRFIWSTMYRSTISLWFIWSTCPGN